MLTHIIVKVDSFECVCVPSSLRDKVLRVLQYMCTYVHVLYCVLFYWYVLCSRKANSETIKILYSIFCINKNEIKYIYRKK